MALQTSLNGIQRRGKKPARRHKVMPKTQEDNAGPKPHENSVGPKPQWVEGGPSYLDGIRATLATLTEEEKEALHLSLQIHILDR